MRVALSKRVDKLESVDRQEESKYHFVICRSQDEIEKLDKDKNHIVLRLFNDSK
jgi:hypothetical protein